LELGLVQLQLLIQEVVDLVQVQVVELLVLTMVVMVALV
tara:strand:- start:29 stop:145 length:117 start_codon:yes stop_codon:yes gene_type:complete